ncbi:MSCRAMM family adhesin SdrC [Lentzea alba]|uniref:SdrD B-like domain-containing protein n=1 Tax=Lentzea alba TaxID=2714351 RepID=UPI0039BF42ED
MSFKIRATAFVTATALVAVPLALSGTAFAQDEPTGYIGGTVFNDYNGDGVKQDNEPGIKSVNVMVKYPSGETHPSETDNYGNWTVKRTPYGEYEVSYVDPKLANTTPSTVKAEVKEGDTPAVNFGVRGGSICGVAWVDANEDGKRQPGEGPLAGRKMAVDGLDHAAVVSGADGVYCFDNVPAGKYSLRYLGLSGDPNMLTKPGGDSKFSWLTRTSQSFMVGKGAQVKGIDAGFLKYRPDLKAVQLIIDQGGVTENNTFKVGDVIEIYGSVMANGNSPQNLTAEMTLPEGLRIVDRVGGLAVHSFVEGQQVKMQLGPWKSPGVVEFLGVRVVVEKEFTGEIKWHAAEHTAGHEGRFPDSNPSDNVLTRKINAVAAPVEQPEQNHGPAVVEVKKTAGLANTGADPVAAGAIGLGALTLGGVALFAARRRKTA